MVLRNPALCSKQKRAKCSTFTGSCPPAGECSSGPVHWIGAGQNASCPWVFTGVLDPESDSFCASNPCTEDQYRNGVLVDPETTFARASPDAHYCCDKVLRYGNSVDSIGDSYSRTPGMFAGMHDRIEFQGTRGDRYRKLFKHSRTPGGNHFVKHSLQGKYTHRPIFVKFKICAGDECEDCPSDTECGWNRTPVYNHLDTVSDKVHVAEFWADCAEGIRAFWTVEARVIYSADDNLSADDLE